MEHELKVWSEFFDPLLKGDKTFELRKDDRGFHAGDVLWLREWNEHTKEYTGRDLRKRVTYLLGGWGLEKDYVCMALEPDLSAFESGANEQGKVIEGLREMFGEAIAAYDGWIASDATKSASFIPAIERLDAAMKALAPEATNVMRTRALEAEAVRDSMAARLSEVVEAVKAERQSVRDYNTASRTKEWKAAWDAMLAACELTDMLVRKHEGAGVSEPITAEALEREGWERSKPLPQTRFMKPFGDNELTWYDDIGVFIRDAHDDEMVLMPNVKTMRDLRELCRLMGAK